MAYAAKKLGLIKDIGLDGNEFGVELSENIKSTMSEIVVVPGMLENGSMLMEMKLPERALHRYPLDQFARVHAHAR